MIPVTIKIESRHDVHTNMRIIPAAGDVISGIDSSNDMVEYVVSKIEHVIAAHPGVSDIFVICKKVFKPLPISREGDLLMRNVELQEFNLDKFHFPLQTYGSEYEAMVRLLESKPCSDELRLDDWYNWHRNKYWEDRLCQ